MEKHGWEMHFVGPDPGVASLYSEPVLRGNEICHYTGNIGFSRHFSVKRNRIKVNLQRMSDKSVIPERFNRESTFWIPAFAGMTRALLGSISSVFYGICQAVGLIFEKMLCFDACKYLEKGMIAEATKAIGRHEYRLVAGLSPDFKILEIARDLACLHHKPFIAIYDDPYGAREAGLFYPAEPEKQKEILDFASGAIFQSPLTRDRYVEQGLIAAKKTFVIHDSFPDTPEREGTGDRDIRNIKLVHLGNLPYYRPIDSILQAFEAFQAKPDNPRLQLDFYGHVYPEALRRIRKSASLSQAIHIHKEVTHSQSHEIAGRSDVLVVVIGPRHTDNVPSKFFEYLCHPKPVLVIGPKGNPVEEMVARLGIGVYSDITRPEDIVAGLVSIAENYDTCRAAYAKNKDMIREYSAERTAERWAAALDACLVTDKKTC